MNSKTIFINYQEVESIAEFTQALKLVARNHKDLTFNLLTKSGNPNTFNIENVHFVSSKGDENVEIKFKLDEKINDSILIERIRLYNKNYFILDGNENNILSLSMKKDLLNNKMPVTLDKKFALLSYTPFSDEEEKFIDSLKENDKFLGVTNLIDLEKINPEILFITPKNLNILKDAFSYFSTFNNQAEKKSYIKEVFSFKGYAKEIVEKPSVFFNHQIFINNQNIILKLDSKNTYKYYLNNLDFLLSLL